MATISPDKLESVKEYYRQGFSVQEISEKLGAPLNATFYFFRKHKIPRRTAQESNELQFFRKPLSFSIKDNLSVKEEKLKVAALMLYWGEGAKRGHVVDLANSDVSVIIIFLKFLREICQVDEQRLRVYAYCYGNQDVNRILKYWSRVTKIPLTQFSQPYVRQDYSMKAGRQMEYGMIHIRYSDKKLLEHTLAEIEKYKQEFI